MKKQAYELKKSSIQANVNRPNGFQVSARRDTS